MRAASPAGNTAAARAKTMYGKRLTEKQYLELAASHTVGEIAAYLKTQTVYAKVLADVKENTVHRGALEQLLRRKLADDLQKLYGYDPAIDRLVGMYYRQQIEIRWILRWLRAKTEEEDDSWFLSAAVTTVNSKLNLPRMNGCQTIAELEETLRGTLYADVLHSFAGQQGLPSVTTLENALIRRRNEQLLEAVRETDGGCRKELLSLLTSQIDVQNFCRIWRLKKYFSAADADIRRCLLPGGSIKKQDLEEMVTAENADEAAKVFCSTEIGRHIPPGTRQEIDLLPERVPFLRARHAMYFSVYAPVICLAYAFLAETELHNLIHIIEGIRYGMSAAEIGPFLIADV